MDRKTRFSIVAVLVLLVIIGWVCYRYGPNLVRREPIKVGILHSLSGTMAISEKSVVDATLLAIEEINERGGLLGRPIEPVVADGKSNWTTFADEAERLITEEKVCVVFGCWTSASRKTVEPVFEKHNHLLFYPVQYEGLEQSPYIVYTGAAPNQQIVPAVKWCLDKLGNRVFLVGSDYVFPRTANAIARDQIVALGATVVGEEYILLGSRDVKAVVEEIVAAQPDVILNTINGDSNGVFFRELRKAGITPDKIPTMSLSIAEEELRTLDAARMVGDYACWNYFQSVDTDENRAFVERFKNKYGQDRVTDDPMEAAYFGVYLWAQAVREAETEAVGEVRKAITKQSLQAPGGLVSVDFENNHTAKTVRIGEIRADGQFDIRWSSATPVQPTPYPVYRSRSEWDSFLEKMRVAWGGSWENPGFTSQIVEEKATEHSVLIEELAQHATVVSAVEASNQKNRQLEQSDIRRLETQWQSSDGDDEFSRECLTNEAAHVLIELQKLQPQFREVFISDAVGLNVAMTNRTSDCYQADEGWWTETYSDGKGKIFLGKLEYDRSAEVWGTAICVPVYNDRPEAIGVIKAFLSTSDVLAIEDSSD